MNSGKLVLAIGVVVVLAILAMGSMFTVRQTHQALVMQFGEPRRVITEPGLKFKLPLVQSVSYLEKRVLWLDDIEPQEVIASDQKRLVVDSFARFRIADPLKFYQSVGNEAIAAQRLEPIINSNVRQVLGTEAFSSVMSGERAGLMRRIRDSVNKEAADFGLDVVDVRIKRADLPQANSQAIYRRMQTEREREAKEFRAQGAEMAQRIRSRADRERTVLLAEATKQAEILRGEGDGRSIQVFAEAFGKDVNFFEFYRSMQAYRSSLGDNDTTMVLSPDSEFFRYLGTAGKGN